MTSDPTLQARVDAKIRRQHELIPTAWRLPPQFASPAVGSDVTGVLERCGFVSSTELEILDILDPRELSLAIRNKKYTVRQVTEAYCTAAAVAHQLVRLPFPCLSPSPDMSEQTDCLTEILFDEALARADQLDAEFERTGEAKGAMFGLPVSLKDLFAIKGVDTSIGALPARPGT